jgi:hypothetical protein
MAEANWFWAEGDKRNGPVAPAAIARLVADGKLGPDDLIWKEGMPDWIPVRKVPALMKFVKAPAAVPTPVATVQRSTVQQPIPVTATLEGDQTLCPHCSAVNTGGGQFCEACGMALPQPYTPPRIVDSTTFATTVAGQQLQTDEFTKVTKKASTALLWVAVIQSVVGGILLGVFAANGRIDRLLANPLSMAVVVVAAIFWGLYVWSRRQPLPAAIVGLVLYATLVVLNIVNVISQASTSSTQFNRGIGGTGVGWLDIVIMAVLSQAISAGLKLRKMQATNTGPTAQ